MPGSERPFRRVIVWAAYLFLQVGLVAASVPAGLWLATVADLVPTWLLRENYVKIAEGDGARILRHFVIWSALVLGLSGYLLRDRIFVDRRKMALTLYALATSLSAAAWTLFISAGIRFRPEAVLGVGIVAIGMFLGFYLSVRIARSGVFAGLAGLVTLAAEVAAAPLRKPALVPVILFAFSPLVGAKIFTENREFADAVTAGRVSLNLNGDDEAFALVNGYPGIGFNQPMTIRFSSAAASDAYVLERAGRIVRVSGAGARSARAVVLAFEHRVGPAEIENGALGLALHPRFGQPGAAEAGYVYVLYTDATAGAGSERQTNRLSRFDLSLPTAEARLASETPLFAVNRVGDGFHNGGTLAFGPDGFLYVSMGEASDEDGRQRIDKSLFGGVLRIDVDRRGGAVSHPPPRQPEGGETANYFIPGDNPFVGVENALEEFWALGLRNPFRMAFDPATGALWAGDVGSSEWEEINILRAGGNYEYPYREGVSATSSPRPDSVIGTERKPVYYYAHTALLRAVIGGVIYRGGALPGLAGSYVFADNYSGQIFAFPADAAMAGEMPEPVAIARSEQVAQRGISSLAAGPDGEVLVTTLGSRDGQDGRVWRLLPRAEAKAYNARFADVEARAAPAAAVVDAASLFGENCARCHGATGRGDGPDSGLLEGVTMPDFTAATYTGTRSDDELLAVILEGGAAIGLGNQMPRWDAALSEAEARALVTYLRGLGAE